MTGSDPDSSVAVLHAGALGDCVLAIHFSAIVRASLKVRVTMIARSPLAQWAARHGFIDDALSLDEVGAHRWHLVEPQKSDVFLRRFDQIVSLLGGLDEPISRKLHELSGKPVWAIDPRVRTDAVGVHITWQWVTQLREQGVEIDAETRDLRLGEVTRRELRARLSVRVGAGQRRIVIVHPGSGGRAKCCPMDAMESVFREMERRERRAVWMIGPDEVERDGLELVKRLEATGPVLFEESVVAAADLAAGADAYIGNDAGMTHVAALAGVPTIALFGPTDPRVWRPLGSNCKGVGFPKDPADRFWAAGVVNQIVAC